MEQRGKIAAIDFDGVIAKWKEWEGIGKYGPPIPGAALALQQLIKAGWHVIIFTARKHDDHAIMHDYLQRHEIPYHTITNQKPPEAHVYLDDRGLNFGGDWATTLFDILSFEPYYFQSRKVTDSGSGHNNNIILVNRVFKEATADKMRKLMDEVAWLRDLPVQWKRFFPEIVLSGVDLERAYFEMPDYNLPSLRRLIINGVLDSNEVLGWTTRVLDLAFEMYRSEKIHYPYGYMGRMYFDRVNRRLDEAETKSPVLAGLINQNEVVINGEIYPNLRAMNLQLSLVGELFMPEYCSRWGHGDLHYSNILVDQVAGTFLLIDPRGHTATDYYYDFGKILHSTMGKYEMVAEGLFTLEEQPSQGVQLEFLQQHSAYGVLERVNASLPELFATYSGESKDIMMMKAEFANAMHFAAIAPFLLDFDGLEKKAKAGYYLGVLLCADLIRRYL